MGNVITKNRGYAQIRGPFSQGVPVGLDLDMENNIPTESVERISVQTYNSWPLEAFNPAETALTFTLINNNKEKGNLNFIIGKSGTLELDDLKDIEVVSFKFNKDMPASTLIEIEFSK